MKDIEAARQRMIDRQIIARGIRDNRVLEAIREVPRHLFVDESLLDEAYDDNPLPIGEGQTISQPYMAALMTHLLELGEDQQVLEIGTGSGYQAAILARLCRWVYTIERIKVLSEKAHDLLERIGYANVTFIVGDGSAGWPSHAPYDGIIVTAGAPKVPEILVDQLRMGGRLVIPVGDRFSQTLKRVIRTRTGIKLENYTGCRFVDLIGKHGWTAL